MASDLRTSRLALIRFTAAAEAVIDAAGAGDGPVWLALGDVRWRGHPVLDRAPRLVVGRDRSLRRDMVLLVRAGPAGRPQLHTTAGDVTWAVVAIVLAVGARAGRPVRLSCPSRRQAARLRRLLARINSDPAHRPGVHLW